MSDHGSERMRAAIHAEVEREAATLMSEVSSTLAPHRESIQRLAEAILSAPDHVLSRERLQSALAEAMRGDVGPY